jgi:hypothetical protein
VPEASLSERPVRILGDGEQIPTSGRQIPGSASSPPYNSSPIPCSDARYSPRLVRGYRKFRRVAVVADTEAPTPPWGACRHILWEFGGDLEVILADLRRETGRRQLKDLSPLPFDARLL